MSKTQKGCLVLIGAFAFLFIIGLLAECTGAAQPASTPVPTATPRPTATPIPGQCPTAEEAAYLRAVQDELEVIGPTTIEVGELLSQYSSSREWATKVAGRLFVIRVSGNAILDLSPPRSIRSVSAHYESAIRKMLGGVDRLIYGLDNNDGAAVDDANTLWTQGAADFELANAALDEHCAP